MRARMDRQHGDRRATPDGRPVPQQLHGRRDPRRGSASLAAHPFREGWSDGVDARHEPRADDTCRRGADGPAGHGGADDRGGGSLPGAMDDRTGNLRDGGGPLGWPRLRRLDPCTRLDDDHDCLLRRVAGRVRAAGRGARRPEAGAVHTRLQDWSGWNGSGVSGQARDDAAAYRDQVAFKQQFLATCIWRDSSARSN